MQFATVQPIIARPDLPVITDEEAAALARTTVNLFRAWGLTDGEARVLLGDMAQRTWARWKVGDIGRIDRDLRARMAILMGIHKALRYLFTEPARVSRQQKGSATIPGVHAAQQHGNSLALC